MQIELREDESANEGDVDVMSQAARSHNPYHRGPQIEYQNNVTRSTLQT
jgi:hypothetical protein